MVFQKLAARRSSVLVSLLATLLVLAGCQTERPSPTEPSSEVQLFGFVHGAAGSTLSGATVSIGTHTASSDSTGLYRLTGLSTGHESVTVKRAGFQDVTKTVDLDRSVANQLDITLIPASGSGTISGDVGAAVGPLSGVTMTADGVSVTTSSDGTFSLSGLTAGAVMLNAHKDGFEDVNSQVNSGDSVHVVMTARVVTPPTGPPTSSTATLSGTVTAAGSPVSGAVVSAQGQTATTATDGRYLLTALTSGTTTVSISKSGFTTASQTVTLNAGANALNITLLASGSGGGGTSSLSGTIATTTGTPIADATITTQSQTVTSGIDGKYNISGLPAGLSTVTVSKTGFQTNVKEVTLVNGSNTLNISLTSGSDATVRVYGRVSAGSIVDFGIAGATLTFQGKTTTSAADGSFELKGLTFEPGTFTTTKPGFKDDQRLNVTPDMPQFSVNIKLVTSSVSISGPIIGALGAIPGVTVTVQGITVVSDDRGWYFINGLTSGSQTVTARKEGYQNYSTFVNLHSGDQNQSIYLER
ncbi:MAG TPA: carboxypeptidase regulatory-like domain-containing protein [Thermoanaerobaculia bacterium]|nr:carboxypeptidase regulatory-like domain-containing protein [Thermoanaerobaculia bacterium]